MRKIFKGVSAFVLAIAMSFGVLVGFYGIATDAVIADAASMKNASWAFIPKIIITIEMTIINIPLSMSSPPK